MFSENELLPLSALQHLLFCERQCALIHLEQQWTENVLTVQGRGLHTRSDLPQTESRGDLRLARGLHLRSLRLGLVGRADLVEFHRLDSTEGGVALSGIKGRWQPFPVEYKHGKPKTAPMDEVQLCGQAMCLEEMLGAPIAIGALYYGKTRHRHDVVFGDVLRHRTEDATRRLRDLIQKKVTPPAICKPKCNSCSLVESCMPSLSRGRKASAWLRQEVRETVG